MEATKYLRLARASINSAKDLTSGEKLKKLRLNNHQCKYLAQKLSGTGEVLQSVQSSADSAILEQCKPALREIYRVVTDAHSLIKDCGNEKWLETAARQRDLKEDFAAILYEVEWCTSLLCSISHTETGGRRTAVFEVQGCEGYLSVTDYLSLETAAKDDRKSLRSDLNRVSQEHVCDKNSNFCLRCRTRPCLAWHLLDRLDNGESPTAGSGTISPPLLCADPRDVKDGRSLGIGSCAAVFQTSWQGENYAKKVFQGAQENSFTTEAAALAILCHPHVVRLVCWCQDGNKFSLVMDLMSKDLCRFLDEIYSTDSFSIPAAVDLMLQVAEGMKYLHGRKLAHRDLKSMNILVKTLEIPEFEGIQDYVKVKLADFGLAATKNSTSRYSHQTPNTGTTRYMAPEVYHSGDNNSLFSHPLKADVYSFGILCFEILTGELPFDGVTLSELRRRVRVEGLRPKLPERCPRRLKSLIHRCWDGNARERPDFLEICRDLRYIKGLLLRGDHEQLQKVDMTPFLTKPIHIGMVTGLVGYWEFDEAGDTLAIDASGSCNHATLKGWPTRTVGKCKASLQFDGIGTSVDVHKSVLDTSGSYSVATWVQLADTSNGATAVSQDGINISGFFLQYTDPRIGTDGGKFAFTLVGSDLTTSNIVRATWPNKPLKNVWYYLVGTHDTSANLLKLYVDGALVAKVFVPPAWNATGKTIIGRAKWAGAKVQFWSGKIGDVRIYNRVVSDLDVKYLCTVAQTITTICPPAALIVHRCKSL